MANKTGKGGFKKGQSGNPGGMPKEKRIREISVAQRARELIKDYKLWEGIAQIAAYAEKDSDRLNAMKQIFDRAYGQAPQKVELDVKDTGFVYIPPAESREEWEKRTQQDVH